MIFFFSIYVFFILNLKKKQKEKNLNSFVSRYARPSLVIDFLDDDQHLHAYKVHTFTCNLQYQARAYTRGHVPSGEKITEPVEQLRPI